MPIFFLDFCPCLWFLFHNLQHRFLFCCWSLKYWYSVWFLETTWPMAFFVLERYFAIRDLTISLLYLKSFSLSVGWIPNNLAWSSRVFIMQPHLSLQHHLSSLHTPHSATLSTIGRIAYSSSNVPCFLTSHTASALGTLPLLFYLAQMLHCLGGFPIPKPVRVRWKNPMNSLFICIVVFISLYGNCKSR
jgi:hypothetical protein